MQKKIPGETRDLCKRSGTERHSAGIATIAPTPAAIKPVFVCPCYPIVLEWVWSFPGGPERAAASGPKALFDTAKRPVLINGGAACAFFWKAADRRIASMSE
jgi:hypothetical protein